MPLRVGVGLRRELAKYIIDGSIQADFVEVAPENWLGIGGTWGASFARVRELKPLTAHGLSLSLGSPDPIDEKLLRDIKEFLGREKIQLFSERLSFCSCDNVHLYDLLPLPFRRDAVRHVAGRIRHVQEVLQRRIAVENISYYQSLAPEMSEEEFLTAVLTEADCSLLLDINNVYVNAHNHHYDPHAFLSKLPLNRVAAVHIAGHTYREDGSILDTHGHPIADEVFALLEHVAHRLPIDTPVTLERDFNLPDPENLNAELERIRAISCVLDERQSRSL